MSAAMDSAAKKRKRTPMLLKGETWFPQKDKRVKPREILLSLSNLVRYRTLEPHSEVYALSPASMRSWIRKWDCKI
jgi:hypothetical protein